MVFLFFTCLDYDCREDGYSLDIAKHPTSSVYSNYRGVVSSKGNDIMGSGDAIMVPLRIQYLHLPKETVSNGAIFFIYYENISQIFKLAGVFLSMAIVLK